MISQSPAYNLKVVLKETGLKADVLRAWERRYELPKPQRTPGGHRLYSEYDIETVKWLKARQAEGLSISRAVELWKESVDAGLDPLVGHFVASTSSASGRLPITGERIEILRQNWLEANLAFDGIQADEVLNQAFAMYPIETVCMEIIQRGISDIGNYWYLDKASVQQEHFATALANRRLEALIMATPRPTRQQTVLIGCPPSEQHTFSVLLLNLLLSRRGLKIVYLGADVPAERLEETANAVKPDLIVLAAQQLTTAATLQSMALALLEEEIPLAYGGLIFNRLPRLRERIPGYFLGETLEDAVQMAERLATTPAPTPVATRTDAMYQELEKLYREHRSRIEIALSDDLQKIILLTEHMGDANFFFGNGLTAALKLGDPAFLEADLDWLKRLLTGRRIPAQNLMPYLAAYGHALHKVMGSAGAPITNWINSYLDQNEFSRR